MKLVIVNGSPRKGWNTDLLLKKAEEGAKAVGAEVTYVNLYDLDFKGCRSCLACKRVGGKSLGHCAYPDALKSVLDAIDQSDALILGSPIYYGDISAEARCFFERLLFQYTNFDGGAFYLTHPIKAACVYTMNGTADYMQPVFKKYQEMFSWCFNYVGTLAAEETLQVSDYSQYHLSVFPAEERQARRKSVFPKDLEKAFALGRSIAQG